MSRDDDDDLLAGAVARGWAAEADLVELHTQKAGGAAPSPAALTEQFGRFVITGKLGVGGSATVYRARDPQLDREVAIKVLAARLGDELDLVEARTQARVQHEHVCKVFEVGELGGRPYIVMQLVEGVTLRVAAAARELRLEQKVRLMAEVAEAVHAAHRIGLVHRDLKPTNIMVERDAGGWRPYVMDFGLARETGTHRTATAIVGTPPYMAPEQARGDGSAIDRRTDVYGLGATLYEVLTGEPPFSGESSTAVLLRVLGDEPTPPRRRLRSLPRDLETVVLKCLEKDPTRRYDSARALAEDLERFLDGEPVLARRAGVLYRGFKRLRKHRVAAAALAFAGVGLLGAGVMVVEARRRATEDTAAAQRFGEELKNIENLTRMAALAPLHDTRPERELVRTRMASVEAQMAGLGAAGRAAGHYALGRGHLALGDPTEARHELEEAWRLGDHQPTTALALAEAYGALYELEAQRAGIGRDDAARQLRLVEIGVTYLHPARWYVRAGRGGQLLESPAYTEATIDYLDRRWAEAADGAHRARTQVPWLYEAARLEGDAHRALADELADQGKYDAALAAFERAGACYKAAMEVGRGDARTRRSELARRIGVLELRLEKKGDLTLADFDPVDAALTEARVADPDAGDLHGQSASIDFRRALFLRDTDLKAAMAATDRGIAEAHLEPDRFVKLQLLALIYWTRGGIMTRLGEDPRPALEQAVGYAEEALGAQAGLPQTHNTAGLALRAIADEEARRGGDPRPALERALAHYRRVAALQPGFVGVWNNLSRALAVKAEYELHHGLDAARAIDEMVAASKKGLELDGANAVSVNSHGNALNLAAAAELVAGRDPRALLNESDAAYRRAAELNPRYAFAVGNLGGNALLRAEWAADDRRPALEEARDWYRRALALNDKYANGYLGLADALAQLGDVAGAREALARAKELRSGNERLVLVQVKIELADGGEAALKRAEEALDAALAERSGVAELWAARAEVWVVRKEKEKGMAAVARALAIDARNRRALKARAALDGL